MNDMKKLLALSIFTLGGIMVAVGCGGSEESTPGTTNPNDSGGGGDATSNTDAPITEQDASKPDTSTPKDAGADVVINAPEVAITYGNCPAFAPCGGDPTGSWKLTGGCVREELFAPAKQFCPGLLETNVVFKGKGTANYAGGTATLASQVSFTADLFIPQSCLTFMGIPITCAQIGPALQSPQVPGGGFDTATCTSKGAGQGCDCKVGDTQTTSGSDTYTVTGNTLTTGAGDTYDICISENATKLESEKTGKEPLPAAFTFAK